MVSRLCKPISFFGIRLGAVPYQVFLERVHPADRNMVDAAVQSSLDPVGTGRYDQEYRIVRPDGELRWVYARGTVFFDKTAGQCRPTRFMGTLVDWTEDEKTKQALLQSERVAPLAD
jgi:PAS domain-containing protein